MLIRSTKLALAVLLLAASLVIKAESPSDEGREKSIADAEPSADEKNTDRPAGLRYDLNLHEDRRGNRLRLEIPLEPPSTETERSRRTQEHSRNIAPEVPETPLAPESPGIP